MVGLLELGVGIAGLSLVLLVGGNTDRSADTATPPDDNHADDDEEEMTVSEQMKELADDDIGDPAFPPGEGPNASETPAQQRSSPAHSSSGTERTQSSSVTYGHTPLDGLELEFDWQTETGVNFEDVGGMDAVKETLQTDVITPMENQEQAAALGVTPANIVFHGPPGIGKTHLAKALATELEVPVVLLSGADLQSKWINESASLVNSLFKEARQVAARAGGAMVFLDELDSVLKQRSGSANAHEEDTKVVNEFLSHLEQTGEDDIVFIGATNRIDVLDSAGVRSGRIDRKIEIGRPDTATREAIVRTQLEQRPHNLSDGAINAIADATEGAVAADLERLIEEGAKQALNQDRAVLRFEDIRRVTE